MIKSDLKNMINMNLFSNSRMRIGLTRLFHYTESRPHISQNIENALIDLNIMDYKYIPQIELLWRDKGRFPVEYFWKRNIRQNITLFRNNFRITVSS